MQNSTSVSDKIIHSDRDRHPLPCTDYGKFRFWKSVAVSYLLGRRLQADPKTHVFICDYKNSEDFRFLNGYENYYTGERCYDGIMAFYQRFHETRESGGAEKERYLLVFDEYPAFLNRLQMLDKQNKEKRAADVMNAVSEVLMLGRGLHLESGL